MVKYKFNEITETVNSIYTPLYNDIRVLKDKIIKNLRVELEKLGFVMVAEWLDYKEATLINDNFLISYNNKLHTVYITKSHNYVSINNVIYKRFKGINMENILNRGYSSVWGYYINEDGSVMKKDMFDFKKTIPRSFEDKEYHDLLRKSKIEKLLNNEQNSI